MMETENEQEVPGQTPQVRGNCGASTPRGRAGLMGR